MLEQVNYAKLAVAPPALVSCCAALPLQRRLGSAATLRAGLLVLGAALGAMCAAELSPAVLIVALVLLGAASCLGPVAMQVVSVQAGAAQQASVQAAFSANLHAVGAASLALHGFLFREGVRAGHPSLPWYVGAAALAAALLQAVCCMPASLFLDAPPARGTSV
jgi:hypothetical protein